MELNDPGEKETNKPEKPIKLSKLDNAILTTIKANNTSSKSEIAHGVVGLGVTNHIQSVYNRLKQKDYLQAEIQRIRDYNRQHLDREIVPIALKQVKKVIKSKTLTADEIKLYKAKEPFIKLAIDKSFGDIHHTEAPQVVNIESIQNAQFLIKADLTDDIPNIEA